MESISRLSGTISRHLLEKGWFWSPTKTAVLSGTGWQVLDEGYDRPKPARIDPKQSNESKAMKVRNCETVEKSAVEMEGAQGCSVRQLVTKKDGAPNFAMRQFEVAPQGHTPLHSHPYEHEVYVLEGSGFVVEKTGQHAIAKGDVVFVAPDDVHQFRNSGDAPMKFLCLVPNDFEDKPITCAVPSESLNE
ncbi:cupin domain-containing protein [Mariniblastus sp.]|nr:cupin domain-containing protein [Mariniblastus sp.]MDB4756034.1 cupin domain-containing protein [Mariniblastus sp.]